MSGSLARAMDARGDSPSHDSLSSMHFMPLLGLHYSANSLVLNFEDDGRGGG